MATILDKLIENNEFPVVFMGAGISKRYLKNFPDWTGLLEEFWEQLGLQNFYGEFNNIRDEIEKANPEYTSKELDHYSNIQMGSLIEEKYNREFNSGNIVLDGFTTKDAFKLKISPFKKAISERFKMYKLKDDIEDEYRSFKKMLLKTQIILTTNYDTFIEDSYDSHSTYQITKFIGQKGFFQDSYGYAELYKLHGCVVSPNDIVISVADYDKFEKNSVLISAKIISMMLISPIIFIGYSLTDINVRKIIKEFTRSLTEEEIQILENRLVLIERSNGEQEFIEEVINDKDLGCKLKVIKTDNFGKLFETISLINQGIAPTEVRKYQHVIKQLIIDRGKKGALNTVLLSPEELDKLEGDLFTKNIAVALGDAKLIFQMPNIISYALDYISDKDEFSTDIRMRLVAMQSPLSRIPANKILDRKLIEASGLHASEKEKLYQRFRLARDFKYHHGKVNGSNVFNRYATKVNDIISKKEKKSKIYDTLSYNIQSLDLDELKQYLVSELEELNKIGEIKLNTEFRRLLLLYDILKYKKGNA